MSPAWPDCMLIRPATVGTRTILRTRRESQYLPGRNYGDLRGTARRRTLNEKKGRIHFTGARTPPPPARTSSPGRDRRWSRRYRIHHRPKRGAPDRLKTPTIPILLGPTVVSAPCSSLRAFLPLQPSSTQEGDQRQARLKLGSTKVPQVRCNSLVPGTQSWREHGSCATLAESCSVTALCVS